ncbi:hypothetical protein FRC10_005508 [Ceratobasidium sp. 414]|nr:hypothetical protein FRC10_005508 [Ceratobasidium sp. 414]
MSFLRAFKSAGSTSRGVSLQRSTPQLAAITRSLHLSRVARTPVQKSKKSTKNNDEDEDAFSIEEEELFATPADPRATADVKGSISQEAKIAEGRAKRFQQAKNKLLANPAYAAYYHWREQNAGKPSDSPIAEDTVEQKHARAMDPPRRAVLAKMIIYASTRAELLEIVDTLSIFREKRWLVDEINRIDFIGRCIGLKSPDIALAVLYHRPQYGIDIPSLSTGRALLHSLLYMPYPPSGAPLPDHLAIPTSTPFTHALLLSNLFDIYALPPVESDEVTRALLLGACAKHEKKDVNVEDVGTITQKIRQWVQSRKTVEDPNIGEVGLPAQGPTQGVNDGRLIRSVKAIKERGKVRPEAKIFPVARAKLVPLEHAFLYNDELTTPERTWIKGGLDSFVEWAQEKGEDVGWVEKLRVQAV